LGYEALNKVGEQEVTWAKLRLGKTRWAIRRI
jgi:hypothetical protein